MFDTIGSKNSFNRFKILTEGNSLTSCKKNERNSDQFTG